MEIIVKSVMYAGFISVKIVINMCAYTFFLDSQLLNIYQHSTSYTGQESGMESLLWDCHMCTFISKYPEALRFYCALKLLFAVTFIVFFIFKQLSSI